MRQSKPSAGRQTAVESFLAEVQPKTAQKALNALRDLFADTLENMLRAELDAHLGYQKHDQGPKATENRRNGTTPKTVRSELGEITLHIPRDRDGEFEPTIVPKNSRDVSDIQDKVIAMYGRGMSDRDISKTIREIYGFSLSAETISHITEAVIPQLRGWQSRPLKDVYPFVYIDALYTDVKKGGSSRKQAVYVILGIDADGYKDVLGMWSRDTEGAKEWLNIFDELKQRGVQTVCFLSADGLKGVEEAARAAFGEKLVFQRCIVHLIRNSLKYVPSKHYKEFCADLRAIYKAVSQQAARAALEELEKKWGENYSGAVRVWRDNFRYVEQLFDYPADIRRVIYTTNPIESLNSALRKVTDRKGSLPGEDALMKLLYLRIQSLLEKWNRPLSNWALIRGKLDLLIPGWNEPEA
jgi:transposase-like protein